MRRTAGLVVVTAALLTATGCGGGNSDSSGSTPENSASGALEATQPTVAEGTFAPYSPSATAIAYDPKLIPSGASAHLTIAEIVDTTTVTLDVRGLLPNRTYGAHLHTMPCGPTGKAAGPHYQHRPDPAAAASPPSVDQLYANPQNEVWLDVTTDSQGTGTSKSTQQWRFATKPKSLVIHAKKTETADGEAGMAGDRLACLTVQS
ncbi:superoxide dismutase family protein [Cryptosporangium sp. NPDC048952]|uniref:superoxide dismutase family protein n=1 Tax=Cryptosporangium sp. NPDC048952 TaxID=3363961 RepID=UPI0037188569